MRVKTQRDLPVEKIDKGNYEVPEGEESVYHVKIEVRKFDANTGARQSIPRIQKFGSKAWKVTQKNLKKQGYTLDVLHDPTEWLKERNEAKAQTAAQRAQIINDARDKKAKADRDALKEALRKEILEDLKADLKAESKAADEKKATDDKKASESKAADEKKATDEGKTETK